MQNTEESYEISVKVGRTSDGAGSGKTNISISADNDALVKIGSFWSEVVSQAAPFLAALPQVQGAVAPHVPPAPPRQTPPVQTAPPAPRRHPKPNKVSKHKGR